MLSLFELNNEMSTMKIAKLMGLHGASEGGEI